MKKLALIALAIVMAAAYVPGAAAEEQAESFRLSEFTVDYDALCEVRDQWHQKLIETHEPGTWAKMKFEPTNAQLDALGLPSKEILTSRRYPTPTLVTKDGRFYDVSMQDLQQAFDASLQSQMTALPAATTYAGAGCMGIRPGAWLLLLSGGGIGWCSMAHVYGTPGAYDISTAGHCGKTGDTATAIAAFGNRDGAAGVVLLDFGKFATSHDGGLGNDWALIDIYSQYQGLVTPTMCFWGGPRGMYTKTGDLATFNWGGKGPSFTVNPDPYLAQGVVHYGHGLGVGAGGTPRAGASISWRPDHFMFFGAILFGDSGSGANTLAGDSLAANMEAAGIMTHLYIDPLMRQGLGIMGGTRATKVNGTLANGQIVPYPIPVTGLP